jgi:hypothetical protein
MMIRAFVAFVLSTTVVALAEAGAAVEGGPPKPRIFAVSKVEKAQAALKTRPANELLRLAGGDVFEAAPDIPDQLWVLSETKIRHPFMAAAHLAFADHRPLALSPDMIWLLINQAAAAEVLRNPEKYRSVFASHAEGKRTLTVNRDDFVAGSPQNDWPSVFAEFEATVVKLAPDPLAASFSHTFTTSMPRELAARRVTLLNATSAFYQFYVRTMCGIPEIELHGSVDDWRWIRQHAEDFRKVGMRRRIDALIPVLDQFVAAADGKADAAFWRSFYKFSSESGSSYVSGWINLFFLCDGDKALDQVLGKGFDWANAPLHELALGAINLPLANMLGAYIPSGVITQEFVWKYFGETRPMVLRAGFFGISQDPRTLTLKPEIAWQVLLQKTATEARQAMDFLGTIRQLGYFELQAINRDFVFDRTTGVISISKRSHSDTINTDFWERALPLMHSLKTLDLGNVLREPNHGHGNQQELQICKALLALPSLKTLVIPQDLDAECLRILRDRKDWTLDFAD